jgi:hypothetical protein
MILSAGKNVKVLIVLEISSLLTQRGGTLIKIANRLIELFKNDF